MGAEVTPYGDGMVERVRDIAGGAPDLVLHTALAPGVLPDLIRIVDGVPDRVMSITDFDEGGLGVRTTGREKDLVPRYDALPHYAQLAAEGRSTVLVAATYAHSRGSLAFEWGAIQWFTKMALAGAGPGTVLLVGRVSKWCEKWRRWGGMLGALIALAPLLMLGIMTYFIDPTGLAEIIAFEASWAMAAATALWKGAMIGQCLSLKMAGLDPGHGVVPFPAC